MAIIFSDDINDQRGESVPKRVDTVYEYIRYMTEQLEFWARNRTREISETGAEIDAVSEAVEDLEPRIKAYEDSLPVSGTDIIAHKPIRYATYPEAYFDLRMRNKEGNKFHIGEDATMSNDLNDYTATGAAWCRGTVLNKPPNTTQYGIFMPLKVWYSDADKFQFYFAWQDSTPVPYIRWQTNSGTWYDWAEIQTNQDSRRRVNATWKVTSTSAAATEVTNRVTLTKGFWVVHAHVPEYNNSNRIPFRLTTVSGTTDIDTNWWEYMYANNGFTEVVRVTSDTAVIVMIIGSSTSITYSSTERGGLRCLKV